MKYALSEYTAEELSTLKEAIDFQAADHERYIKAVEHNRDLIKLLDREITIRRRKLSTLYDQRVHVLTAFQSVQRLEKAISN